jgi:hypothetical protein
MSWESVLKKEPKICPRFPNKKIYYQKWEAQRAQKRLFKQKGIQFHVYTCPHRFKKRKNSEKTRPHFHLSKRHEVGR